MRAGAVVKGRFEIERLAGAGGMGSVYRARDLATSGPVAVKVVKVASTESVRRFEREALVLSRLTLAKDPKGQSSSQIDSGIVGYIAHGQTEEGEMFLVMEWLEGESLSERLSTRGLTVAQTITLGRRVARALGISHTEGVIHRDVKPSNVFLPGGSIELATIVDFGIAHLASAEGELTTTGAMLGTPSYISPEQAKGERSIDARTDVFSLGAVLYKCLTGRPPFIGDDAFAVLLKVTREPVVPPSALRPSLPEDLDRLVVRMLSKTPDERPENGAAVAAILDTIAPIGDSMPPPKKKRGTLLAEGDRKMICLVAATLRESADAAVTTKPAGLFDNIASRHRGRVSKLGDGKWAISLGTDKDDTEGTGRTTMGRILAPTDLAIRSARCALAVQTSTKGKAQIAVASGRFAHADPFPSSLVRGAFDLQDTAPGGPIRIDEMTASLLDARFDITKDATGIALAGERGDAEIGRTLLGHLTPCVGREQELVTLEAAIAASVDEHVARVVLVLAAAGMGKSRLRAELLRRVHKRDIDITVWSSAADAMGQLSAFSLLGGVVRRALGIDLAEDAPAKLAAQIDRKFDGAQRVQMREMLGALAGVASEDEPSPKLRAARRDARLMADQMRLAWEDFVAAECARKPVLLVLEDVQWADAASIELVDAALRRMQNGPFMVLALGRPETLDVFPSLFRNRDVQELRLGPLSKRASEKLVRQVLGASRSDEEVTEIATRAAGNAFYLEELIRAASEGSQKALPESIRAMLEARLGTLDPVARRIVRAASVLGQTFWRGAIVAVLGGEVTLKEIDEQLADLVRREMCTQRPVSRFAKETEYTFRHALVRDAAYATLSDEDAKLVHRILAEWLRSAGERRGSVIGEHFERGGAPEQAIPFYVHAAEQALEASDPKAAIGWTERAIACGAQGETLGYTYRIQAEGHNWAGSLLEAEKAAIAAMERLPPAEATFFAAAGEAVLATARVGHIDALLALVPELLRDARTADANEEQVQAVANAAIQLLFLGRYDNADALFVWLDKAIPHLVDVDPKIAAPLAKACAWRALFAGDPATYLSLAITAGDAYDAIGDMRNRAHAQLNAGYGCMQIGDFEAAERWFSDALRANERLGSAAPVIRHNLGLVLAYLGRIDEAIEVEETALRECDPAEQRIILGCELYLAMIHQMAGNGEEALRRVSRVLTPTTAPPIEAGALGVQARVLLDLGRTEDALQSAERAMDVLGRLQRIDEGEAYIRLAHAEARKAFGDEQGARAAIRAASERLMERAGKIADGAIRERFLTGVPENARTLSLDREWNALAAQGS